MICVGCYNLSIVNLFFGEMFHCFYRISKVIFGLIIQAELIIIFTPGR